MRQQYEWQRFLDAQDAVYVRVLAELRAGCKQSHWMWFVFPQLRGLGASPAARKFALSCLDEAGAYLGQPVLGARLRECTQLVNQVEGRTIEQIFPYPDNLKFRSSMTLFARASDHKEELFEAALRKYFGGKYDARTLELLGSGPRST